MPLLDPFLKEILICPQCRGALEEREAESKLFCAHCELLFPVKGGLPNMLLEEAENSNG
jgi:uncharacterized protein